MKYRTLGKSEIPVSNVALGTWGLSGEDAWGPQDEAESLATIKAAYEEGVRLFETARSYGNGRVERLLGKALGDVRSRVGIATRVGPSFYAPNLLRSACEDSLRNLDTDYIDLFQLQAPNPKFPIAETLGILEQLRTEGKIREYGVSNFGARELAATLAPRRFAVAANQLPYSLLFRAVEESALPQCRKERIGVLAYAPLLHGVLTGKFTSADEVPAGRADTRHFSSARPAVHHGEEGAEAETFETLARVRSIARDLGEPITSVSLAWLLAQPGVDSVVAGARTAYQARRNARAGKLVLPFSTVKQLADATEPLKKKLGPGIRLWGAG